MPFLDADGLTHLAGVINGKYAGKNKHGAVVSVGADYAEYGTWQDGNPNNEDRRGLFVTTVGSGDQIAAANHESAIVGVTTSGAGFIGNYSKDAEDNHALALVGILGQIPVIDNGKCKVGERCMPADDGTAIPSDNTCGYKVIDRLDATHVIIMVAPNIDMIYRIKNDMKVSEFKALQSAAQARSVDQIYIKGATDSILTHNINPVAFVNRGTQEIRFLVSFTVGSSNIPANTPLLFNLPKPEETMTVYLLAAYNVASGFKMYTGKIGTDGVLTCGVSLNAGATVYLFNTHSTSSWRGEYWNPIVTAEQAQRVGTWVAQHQGQFEYKSVASGRLAPLTSGYTDCSGVIAAAYKYEYDMWINTKASSIAAMTDIIAVAEPGEELDLSDVREGDMVVFSNTDGFLWQHVAIFGKKSESDSLQLWEMDSAYEIGKGQRNEGATSATLGPQPIAHPRTTTIAQRRMLVRYPTRRTN